MRVYFFSYRKNYSFQGGRGLLPLDLPYCLKVFQVGWMQRSVSLQQYGGVYVGVNLFSIGCKRIFRLRSPEYKKPLTFKYKQILGFLASTQPMGRRSLDVDV
jgi:hypothetical protein